VSGIRRYPITVKDGFSDRQQLASLGERIWGTAHELSNSLSVIVGNSKILQSLDLDQYIAYIYVSALRSLRTVESLIEFLRENGIECSIVNINEIIEKTLSLFECQMRLQDIQLIMNLAPDIPFIRGDFYKLEQAFFHIVMNAFLALDSWEGKKTITVATTFDECAVRIHVSGTGRQPHAAKIFDHRPTAKPNGRGLGLDTAYGIVKAHGGSIRKIQEGEMCTLNIEFPLSGQGCSGIEEFEPAKSVFERIFR
jgi:signal transduction histidine kinase